MVLRSLGLALDDSCMIIYYSLRCGSQDRSQKMTSKLQIAQYLIVNDRLDDLFVGTVFSLAGYPPDDLSINSARWIEATLIRGPYKEGFTWSCTNTPSSGFIGLMNHMQQEEVEQSMVGGGVEVVTVNRHRFSFASTTADNNEPVLNSVSSNPYNRMVEIDGILPPAPGTLWDLKFIKVYNGMLIVDMGIQPPNVPLVNGTIGTYNIYDCNPCVCRGLIGISITQPGPGILKLLCAIPSNVVSTDCAAYCDAGNCIEAQTTWCNIKKNAPTDYCFALCRDNKAINCDSGYKEYCADLLMSNYNNVDAIIRNGRNSSRCSCFFSDQFYANYARQIATDYQIIIDSQTGWCYFPFCSSLDNNGNPAAVLQFQNKTNCGSCPVNSGCITDAEPKFDGTFDGGLTFVPAPACVMFVGQGGIVPGVSNPGVPNACPDTVPIAPIESKRTQLNVGWIIGGIFIGIAVLFIIGEVFRSRKIKHKHTKKKKNTHTYLSL